MVFVIIVGILVIGFITFISKSGSETLTDYASKNPDAAYAATGTSWKDAYKTDAGANEEASVQTQESK